MSISETNFDDLLNTYYFGTAAQHAAAHLYRLVRHQRAPELRELLRDYREEAIYEKAEIDLRAGVDRLLNCYSVIEIALLAGFVADVKHNEFGRVAAAILANKYVRRYYEDYYPTTLPQLFRLRITGSPIPVSSVPGAAIMHFLDLDHRFMRELEDEVFLRMLDSFWFNGLGFGDVIKAIGKPKVFVDHLLRDPKDWDVISRALNQFSSFMQFCFDLQSLLSKLQEVPLLQSAIWHYYGYWFEIIGDSLRRQLGDALAQFLHWVPVATNKQAVDAMQLYLRDAQAVLTCLTSKQYSPPVSALLRHLTTE